MGVMAISGGLTILTIYNAWGIGQNGWFFELVGDFSAPIQNFAVLVTQLAVAEICPPGCEATVDHFVEGILNVALNLGSTTLPIMFLPVFELGAINAVSYFASSAQQQLMNTRMVDATCMTIGINLLGSFVCVAFLPRCKAQCREWAEDTRWHSVLVGSVVCVLGFGLLCFSVGISCLSLLPSTNCLQL